MVTSAEKKARKAEEGAEKSAEKSAKKAKKDKTPKKAAENGAEEEPLVVDAAEVHWRSVLYCCVVYVRLVERHSGTVLSLECGGPCVQAAAAPKKTLLIPIAKPLADEKLAKKVLKLAKKATKRKQIKRGVKEVVKAIRKKIKGCAPARAAGGHSFSGPRGVRGAPDGGPRLQDLRHRRGHLAGRRHHAPARAVRGERHPVHLCAFQGGARRVSEPKLARDYSVCGLVSACDLPSPLSHRPYACRETSP